MNFIFDERRSDSPLVELVWRTHSDHAGTFLSQATSHCELVTWQYEGETGVALRGPETRVTPAEFPAGAEFFGIQFKLGTFMPHLPASTLVDDALTLPQATGTNFWLHGGVWQMPTFENADTFVERLIRANLLVADPVITAALAGHEPDLSPRAVQYRFLRATGLTHSTIRQIERARQAVTLLENGIPILDTAFELGYFDQAHLTRSLKRFTGQTPTQITLAKQPV